MPVCLLFPFPFFFLNERAGPIIVTSMFTIDKVFAVYRTNLQAIRLGDKVAQVSRIERTKNTKELSNYKGFKLVMVEASLMHAGMGLSRCGLNSSCRCCDCLYNGLLIIVNLVH
ncbi:hypothetical protein I7I53_08545 [Histoplasma capsulatum var. duboisii H88]|uniref:Uncharacterized protein n=1 Tax=Ajellomyces capsulatus (strain H88) TaxID=544711 RepID=A0A8A1LFZ1_AJEC8|nr:hypothetical protein I7I53_08545 [Histoplasma capsulatum var. duboisii H88]